MGAADQIVDSISSTNNNNSNNDGEFDDDLKRVSEVLESSKACVFSNPTFFLDKKIFPLPQNVHQNEALKKTSSAYKNRICSKCPKLILNELRSHSNFVRETKNTYSRSVPSFVTIDRWKHRFQDAQLKMKKNEKSASFRTHATL